MTGGEWQLFASERHPIADTLHYALRRARLGDGVLLCLPRDADEGHVGLMIAAARAALSRSPATPARFVVVGDRRGAAGLAKTLHLEAPHLATTLVSLPLPEQMTTNEVSAAVARIVADVAATRDFAEVSYAADGARRVPVLRPLPPAGTSSQKSAFGPQDVLLVTGGGKGITAECALAASAGTGASVALLGRSDPAQDPELAANLDRMAAAGVTYRYVRADVTSGDEVKAAVDEIRDTLGPVTAVLHGAGRNVPQALSNLDESSFRRTLAPKIAGLEAVLAATDPASLRLLVTFGSIIGRAGLRGEADYATANDWLTDLTHRVGEDYPHLRCLAMEWSVWSGAGMGERLGVLESLMREGISPIPVEAGVAMFHRLLADPHAPAAVVVMGRAEQLPTITLQQAELPLLRFIDRLRVYYPGVELVVDADLSTGGDLYLADHVLDGNLLFPAVLGMEAMAQAAAAVTGLAGVPVLENVEFLRPIVVPVEGVTTIRTAVLVKDTDTVEAVIRSSETGFQADHFRATLRYCGPTPADGRVQPADDTAVRVPLDPARELYGSVLFQGRRFQRLTGYRYLAATNCVAEISTAAPAGWFGDFLPADLVLADPGIRDALMHSIQCCVPDATLLPAAVERLLLGDPGRMQGLTSVTLQAAERYRDGDTYVYDLDVRDSGGALVERWEGLRLQAVRKQDGTGPWVAPLLGPYLERRVESMLGTALRTVIYPDSSEPARGRSGRRGQTAAAIGLALGRDTAVRYRPDGKPEIDGETQISASHGAGVTLAVAAGRRVGCDVETADNRTEGEWADLLGADGLALARLLSRERGEDLSLAATRVWGAVESLRKIGYARAELVVAAAADDAGSDGAVPDGWVVLRSGAARIATFSTRLLAVTKPVVFTMLAEGDD
jgi:enediyne polyketide synthase